MGTDQSDWERAKKDEQFKRLLILVFETPAGGCTCSRVLSLEGRPLASLLHEASSSMAK